MKTFFLYNFFSFFSRQWLPAKVQVQPPSPTRGLTIILFGNVQNLQRCASGGSWKWQCNLCSNLYKGSYPIVKEHLLHGGGQGIACYTKTNDPMVRVAYQIEQDDAGGIRRRREELTNSTPQGPPNIEPRIVLEERKRRATQ